MEDVVCEALRSSLGDLDERGTLGRRMSIRIKKLTSFSTKVSRVKSASLDSLTRL